MINDFCWQAIHQRYLVVYEKHFRRTFIHVVDIARAIVHMLECFDSLEYNVFNVGHESLNFTKEDIVKLIKQRVDFLVYFAEFGKDEDRRDYEVDYSQIRSTGFLRSMLTLSRVCRTINGLRLPEIPQSVWQCVGCMWNGTRVLVTGGRGFLGSHIGDQVERKGCGCRSSGICRRGSSIL